MILKGYPLSRSSEIVVQNLKNETLIYDLKINKAFCLNETSALVYELCNGNNSVTEISRHLTKKLKAPVTEDFVRLAIDQLREENLLENSQEIKIEFNGLSRREVIKHVGFASMITLPIITALFAPTAAMAQSAVAGSVQACGTCTTSADCAPGAGTCKTQCPSCGGASICSVGSPNGTPGSIVSLCGGVPDCQVFCDTVIGPQECCSGHADYNGSACVCR